MKVFRKAYILLILSFPLGFIIYELKTIGIKPHNQLSLFISVILILWGFVVFKDDLKN